MKQKMKNKTPLKMVLGREIKVHISRSVLGKEIHLYIIRYTIQKLLR